MAIKIFFCGEVVADLLERQQGSGNFEFLLGGSHFLASRGAARALRLEKLDFQVGFVGPLSNDLFGERFFKAFEDSGINTQGIKRVDRNTTLAIVSICPSKENDFSFYVRDTAEQMTKIEDLPKVLGTPSDQVICFFGSISTVMDPSRFAWLEFAKRQRENSLIFYDLNTRPSIARDPKSYRSIVLEWARLAHVMKASDADIRWAYPNMEMNDVAAIWLREGASVAIFTKGSEGSQAYTRNLSVSVDSQSLIATNTVGAGDNFNAGLAIYFAKAKCTTPDDIDKLKKAQLEEILHGANKTATSHLMSLGAQLSNVT